MIWLTKAWSLGKRIAAAIPWQAWLALGLLVAFWLHGNAEYRRGVRVADERHRIADEKQSARIAKLAAELNEAQTKVTTRIVTEYVDRIKTVREAAKTIVREVPVYVPASSPDLPPGFRIVHDYAVSGAGLPDPATVANAAPVPAQVAAATVADNYGTCRETAEQLVSLQSWVAEQKRVSDANRN